MRPWLVYALLALGAAALSGFTILVGINQHDEGLMLQAASRVLDGQVPYRDFWWNYGPGQPYLLAGLDWITGPSLLWWRVLRIATDALVSVLAYALARRQGAGTLEALGAWLASAAILALPALPGRIPSPNATVLALGLGAALLARRSPVAGGALGGTALAFRLDLGLGAALAAVLSARGRPARVRAGLAALACGALLLGPFFVLGGPARFWDQTLGFALTDQDLQRLALPAIAWVLLAISAGFAIAATIERPPLRALALAPIAAAGLLYMLARADEFHLAPLAVPLAVMLASAIGRARRDGSRLPALALAAGLAAITLYGLDDRREQLTAPPDLARVPGEVADGVRADPGEARALGKLIPYVRARTPGDAPVFVANPRHDRVRVGNPLLYVLLQRDNPTRYDVMQPGVVTTVPVQREMVRDLRRRRPRVVVRWLSPVASQAEGNGSGRSSGVFILDRYLDRAYRPVARFGDYLVLRPR